MPNNTYKALPLLSDIPAGEGSRGDELGFEHTARVLADAAIKTSEPLTIGIFGEWGTGKTSTMRLIEDVVREDDSSVAVWFNAWQYEKEDHLIVPLTATVEQEITLRMEAKKWKGSLAKGAKNLREALRAIAYGFSIKGKVGIPLLSEAEINLSPKDMIERYQDLTKDAVLARSLYFDAFKKLYDLTGNTTKEGKKKTKKEIAEIGTPPRIVVLVDDLDRCFPDKAVELLEGIKLVLHQPGFSFVIGVNDEIIQKFIKTKYEKEFHISGSYFDQYLDKIVQVKVPVPSREPESNEMEQYVRSLLSDEVFDDDNTKSAIIPLVSHACKHNPRSIVRLLNRVMISSRISTLEQKDYDPVALLLHITMDEKIFRDLCDSLNYKLEKADNKTIGTYLAEILKEYDNDDIEWFGKKRDNAEKIDSPALNKAIETLQANKHMCKVLQHPSGQQWLTDKEFREKQFVASSKTIGDSKPSTGKVHKLNELDEIIRQIDQNMVEIPEGSFAMGSEENEYEKPIHEVKIISFWMSKYQVTQAQYEAIMGTNPSNFRGSNNPVENISWDDARAFCEKLSNHSEYTYRLPSEAEWEYACRAETLTKYHSGDSESDLAKVAWYDENSEGKTHPVGKKSPNSWELYDMHGNVWEWCEDDWHDSYEGAPDDGGAWVDDPRGSDRVLRGGGWFNDAWYCRAANRGSHNPSYRFSYSGFRLVRSGR